MQPPGQGHKEQAAVCPAHVVKKKFVLPPKVDLRWGPVQLCEKWYFRLRGYRKAHKPEDEGVLEEEEGKEQAQLNQQEGRATGMYQKHALGFRVNSDHVRHSSLVRALIPPSHTAHNCHAVQILRSCHH